MHTMNSKEEQKERDNKLDLVKLRRHGRFVATVAEASDRELVLMSVLQIKKDAYEGPNSESSFRTTTILRELNKRNRKGE